MTKELQKWEEIPEGKILELFTAIEDNYQPAIVRGFLDFLKANGHGLTEDGLKAYKEHLLDRYKDGEIQAPTIKNYLSMVRSRVKRIAAEFNLDDFTRFRLEKALNNVKVNAKDRDPAIDPEKDVLTSDEITKLIEESDDSAVPWWVAFLRDTGVRITEMLEIRLSDVKYEKDHAEIHIRGKGKRDRTIMVTKDLIQSIKAKFGGTTWLFEHNGKQYVRNSVTTRIRQQGRFLLGRNISAHKLRHTFATRMLEKTKDLAAVSRYLGHSSTSITADIYTHTRLKWDDLKPE